MAPDVVKEAEIEQLVEGVGNDVMTVFLFLCLMVFPFIYYLWQNR